MKLKSIEKNHKIVIEIDNRDDLIILSNALNEVCHGIDLVEFSTRLGAEVEEVKQLLLEITNIVDVIDITLSESK